MKKSDERGPRAGWTFGGLAALLWLLILAGVLFHRDNIIASFTSLAFFGLGLAYIVVFAPWKHPTTPFWRIYTGLVFIILAAAGLLLYLWYPSEFGKPFNELSIFSLFPLLLPAFLFGNRTWTDMHRSGSSD